MGLPASRQQIENEIEWFLDHLRVEKAASSHTVDAYQRDLNRFKEFVSSRGANSLAELNETVLAEYLAYLNRLMLSKRTMARALSAVRSITKFLVREGTGPSAMIETVGFKMPKLLPKALTRSEVAELLDQPDVKTPKGLRDRAMIELMYGAGLRVSELIGITLQDYSQEESVLRVIGKRGKVRIVPIPAETHEWLRKYVEESRSAFVISKAFSEIFLNARGAPLSRSGVFRILREYATSAGIELEIGPHTLRHSYAVHMVQAGADLRSVQELLGHESISTTEVYTRLDLETVQKKYEQSHPRAKK